MIAKGEGYVLWEPLVKSLPKGSLCSATSEGKCEERRRDSLILVRELPTHEGPTSKETTMGFIALVEDEGHDLLIRINPTPSVIMPTTQLRCQ